MSHNGGRKGSEHKACGQEKAGMVGGPRKAAQNVSSTTLRLFDCLFQKAWLGPTDHTRGPAPGSPVCSRPSGSTCITTEAGGWPEWLGGVDPEPS